jgi:rare lipoprotein A
MGIAKVKIEVVGFAGKVESPKKIALQKATHTERSVKMDDFGIQVGAFRSYAGARTTQAQYRRMVPGKKYRVEIKSSRTANGMKLYRVWLMGFPSESAARDYRACQGLKGPVVSN